MRRPGDFGSREQIAVSIAMLIGLGLGTLIGFALRGWL